MGNVAAGFMSVFGEALLRPGDNERDLGLRYAETLRNLGPLAAPTLGHMLNLRLREVIRNAAVGEAELRSGHLPGAQPVTVGFVDIVGFTRLGEEIPPEDLGELVRGFERAVRAGRIARAAGEDDRRRGDAGLPHPHAGGRRGAGARRGLARRTRAARCCAAGSRQARRCSAPATGTGGP